MEVGESYAGGKEKNEHHDKKLNTGRGKVGETAVVDIKEGGSRKKIKSFKVANSKTISLRRIVYDSKTNRLHG